MESKNMIIGFVWTFVLAAIIILSLEGEGLSFAGYVVFFLIALTSTVAVDALIPGEKQLGSELQTELESIRSRLDELQAESGRSP
jgi:hypothetical protein